MEEVKTDKPDNPPAFPRSIHIESQPGMFTSAKVPDNEGMTLRDYFAGQAVTGLITASEQIKGVDLKGVDPEELYAHMAYMVADAMLERRAR